MISNRLIRLKDSEDFLGYFRIFSGFYLFSEMIRDTFPRFCDFEGLLWKFLDFS